MRRTPPATPPRRRARRPSPPRAAVIIWVLFAALGRVPATTSLTAVGPSPGAVAAPRPVVPGIVPTPPGGGSPSPAASSPPAAPARCGPPGGPGPSVTVLRQGDRCVAPAVALRYRCSPAVDPVLALATDGGVREYLGGRFALPVAAPPKDARTVGAGPAGTAVVRSRANPDDVVVRSKGVLARWLPLRGLAGADPTPSVTLLGDSVMLGARDDLLAGLPGWSVTVDARLDRSTPEGLAAIEAEPGGLGDVAVIQLGTNDGGRPDVWAGDVERILQRLDGLRMVVWLTIREARSYYADDNRLLREVAARHRNTVVADWNAAAPASGLAPDGLHLGPAGARAMTALVRSYLEPWREAATGRGATGCRSAVRLLLGERAAGSPRSPA